MTFKKLSCNERLWAVALVIPLLIYFVHCYLMRKSHKEETFIAETPKGEFVMYWAGWCGHCKHAKPAFERLLEKYPGSFRMVDCTKPDAASEHRVTAFPAYRWYPSKSSKDFEIYKGGRDMKSMEDFFLSH